MDNSLQWKGLVASKNRNFRALAGKLSLFKSFKRNWDSNLRKNLGTFKVKKKSPAKSACSLKSLLSAIPAFADQQISSKMLFSNFNLHHQLGTNYTLSGGDEFTVAPPLYTMQYVYVKKNQYTMQILLSLFLTLFHYRSLSGCC